MSVARQRHGRWQMANGKWCHDHFPFAIFLLPLMLVLSSPAWAILSVVQAQNVDNTGVGLTSLSVSINTSANNLLVCLCGEGTNNTDTFTISDSASNPWTQIGGYLYHA